MQKIVKLKPFISEKVWGGSKLNHIKKLNNLKKIGETWEVSTHPDGSSFIADSGHKLSDNFSVNYIVKFIDAADNLSVQVHPGDTYALEHEKSSGKTECWLILDSEAGAGIYLGFKPGVTRKEFFNAVENNLPCDRFLNFIPVKRGDFFFLPPGSVHAIGSGVTLCEVQQSSGITYRVWDWNRMGLDGKPRELHIEQAKDVLEFGEKFNHDLVARAQKNLLEESRVSTIAKHQDFKVELFSQFSQSELRLNLKANSSIVILEGDLEDFEVFDSLFVTEAGSYTFQNNGPSSFILIE